MITYFASASTPADNGSNLVDPTAVTPPSGMQAGDLVVMEASSRDTASAHAISQAGGQTWTAHAQQGVTNRSVRVFTCTFDGTWTADPSVSAGSGFCNSLIMHVYRPPGAGYTWAVNVAQESAPGSGETWTITGQTTTGSDETVTIASFSSWNDNTWGSLAGAGWAVAGAAQYRNVAGQDQSSAFAHKIQTSAGATGDVSLTQLTLAGQGGLTWILTMAAVPPAATSYEYTASGGAQAGGSAPRAFGASVQALGGAVAAGAAAVALSVAIAASGGAQAGGAADVSFTPGVAASLGPPDQIIRATGGGRLVRAQPLPRVIVAAGDGRVVRSRRRAA